MVLGLFKYVSKVLLLKGGKGRLVSFLVRLLSMSNSISDRDLIVKHALACVPEVNLLGLAKSEFISLVR